MTSNKPSRRAHRRARLDALTKITDLFLAGSGRHTDERIALFDGVFLALVHTIEVNARAQLSRRLASEANAPPRLVRTLAFDDVIAVAAPVLMPLRAAERSGPDRECQHQEPGASLRHHPAANPERTGDRRPGRAWRQPGGAARRQECRRALLGIAASASWSARLRMTKALRAMSGRGATFRAISF